MPETSSLFKNIYLWFSIIFLIISTASQYLIEDNMIRGWCAGFFTFMFVASYVKHIRNLELKRSEIKEAKAEEE